MSDRPVPDTTISAWFLLREAWAEFQKDQAPSVAAALAYYTILSVAPLLLVLIAIGGLALGDDAARAEVVRGARQFVGPSGTRAIETMIEGSADRQTGRLALWIGIGGLLLGASSVATHLKESVNVIWDLPRSRATGFLTTLRERALSLVVVLAIGLLLFVSLGASAAIAAVGARVAERLRGGELTWQVADVLLSIAVNTFLFALLFKFVPDIRVRWRDVWTGAFFTSLLFVIGKVALALWLGKGSIGSTYGAAASFLILLIWIYYSSLIFFFGAEFTQVHARAHRRGWDADPEIS
ncbi:MAG TPA: YihY/virulence factor BrkB family protein [Thermoanaerobaculia bacterium]|nr:YihY/virulence factor BrkB family protein [Thermoanaerobaculia bacterium]